MSSPNEDGNGPYRYQSDANHTLPPAGAANEPVAETTALTLLRNLVRQMEIVHDDPAFVSVWTVNQLHAGPYTGPKYEKEFEAALTFLAVPPSSQVEQAPVEQDALDRVKDQPDWPPQMSSVGLPEGQRRYGSTGQLWEVHHGQWWRIRAVSSQAPAGDKDRGPSYERR